MHLFLDGIRFVGREIAPQWYVGDSYIHLLSIKTQRLDAIHSNAFNENAFSKMQVLQLHIVQGSVQIYEGAYRGCAALSSIHFYSLAVESLPPGHFHPFAETIELIAYEIWPNTINLDQMFDGKVYSRVSSLTITLVEWPRTIFRTLAASNFTAFRNLAELVLMNCGIEVIQPDTFYVIGKTLEIVDLDGNAIKIVVLDMFRTMFETKKWPTVELPLNRHHILCSCRFLEMDIMQCPIQDKLDTICYQCKALDGFDEDACGLERSAKLSRFCVKTKLDYWMRYVRIRMAHQNEGIAFATKFSSWYRVIAINLTAMMAANCSDRTVASNFKCFMLNESVEQLTLSDLGELRHAEFMSITAIPLFRFFAARPMHSITIRRQAVIADTAVHEEQSWQRFVIFLIVGVFSVPIGVGAGISVAMAIRCGANDDETPAKKGAAANQSSIKDDEDSSDNDYDVYYEQAYEIVDPPALPAPP